MPAPIAYFLTFTCYGQWLHGDERTSIDKNNNTPAVPPCPPSTTRERFQKGNLKDKPVLIDAAMRGVIDKAIRETCEVRQWKLWALNVRTNHIHVVVTSSKQPEPTMSALKAWATRRLREARLIAANAKMWTRHGSTRWINSDKGMQTVCEYVVNGQGGDLPMEL
ncbi:MAG: transposase [Planctomycetes bacterium]|nr:transposase [Planctomycetota bacterium]